MCNFIDPPSPFCYGFSARIDRPANAFLKEIIIELSNAWCSGLINERMIDGADSSTSVDASVAIDGEDFLETGKMTSARFFCSLVQLRCSAKKSAVALKSLRW